MAIKGALCAACTAPVHRDQLRLGQSRGALGLKVRAPHPLACAAGGLGRDTPLTDGSGENRTAPSSGLAWVASPRRLATRWAFHDSQTAPGAVCFPPAASLGWHAGLLPWLPSSASENARAPACREPWEHLNEANPPTRLPNPPPPMPPAAESLTRDHGEDGKRVQ